MPTFKAPQYSKMVHATTKAIEPCYTFPIEFADSEETPAFVADDAGSLSLESLQHTIQENVTWWNDVVQSFLQASIKLFSKPYTIQQIHKISKHSLQGTEPSQFPVHVTVQPVTIQIRNGAFWVHWKYTTEPLQIDIPDLAEPDDTVQSTTPLPVHAPVIDGVHELNLDDLPIEKNATEVPLTLDPPTKFYDKHKVKEARLKAKLAMYRAQHQMTKYYEKYGTELTDSDTGTGSDTGDESEEEVQL
jgi:hypothetical protein